MKKPLVSIITPSFNQALYLEETINSVINQEYDNIEYIIIDGGSNDGSVEIITKYANHIAFWVSGKDKGQADAINKGFSKATGEYICWLNSDDIMYTDFISRRIKEFQQYPEVEFIYGDVHQGIEMKQLIHRRGKKTDFTKMVKSADIPIPQQSAIWKRSVLDKAGLLQEKWHVLLDREFFMRIALYCKIKYIPGAVAFFRNHALSKSIAEAMRWTEEMPEYYTNLFKHIPEKYSRYKKECLTNMYMFCAMVAKEAGSIHEKDFLAKAKNTSKINYYFYKWTRPIKNHFKLIIEKVG